MTRDEIQALLHKQRDYFHSGVTLPVDWRLAQLKKLHHAVQTHEQEISRALQADLGKSSCEAFMCEIGLVLSELSFLIRHTRSFARRRTVPTPLSQFAARSYVQPIPRGNVLIMSPWNYPFLLTIEPLADAIAAGNTAILKPSAYAPHTSALVAQLVTQCFPPEYVAVVTGGRAENTALLEQKFDLIFFTGSQAVGKEVLRRAAEHLTPAVLELGGKSPCIVDETADVKLAARRIVFGKFLNCGQTCVAPDYILCHSSIREELVRELTHQIRIQYGSSPLACADYGKIVNRKHFDRLCALIDPEKVVVGGQTDPLTLQIAPTIMDAVTSEDAVMGQEIFGPILPVLTYEHFDQVLDGLKGRAKPLALYLFSHDRQHIARITGELSYGGGCINDVVIHLASSAMGFGGVGESGMGSYHGKAGFDAFSHLRSMVDKKTWLDLPMRYQPYTSTLHQKLIRLFLR